MPEGDTIFRSARALHRVLAGSTVTGFETAYAQLASVDDDAPVSGRLIEKVESRGKWLLIFFSGDLILLTHMLMSGSWHFYRRGERWQKSRSRMRIVIQTENYEAVAFDVPVAQFHNARSLARHPSLSKLGPDLAGGNFEREDARARLLSQTHEEVGNALLDQRVIAGIGNVFKSEICFVCGINPFRPVRSLSGAEIDTLLDASHRLMQANVQEHAPGGIVTYTGPRRTTRANDPAARLWVYRRAGQECRRCGAAVLMRKQGTSARSTYWCPECQPKDPRYR
ncbi:MAG TPA: DNA-formamidopyrimidine glycosylase family protein [Silvibacterium sp.]|nr:DNA-formamidopyrimidine glycosylase family protein [Silvibacterium sp.]